MGRGRHGELEGLGEPATFLALEDQHQGCRDDRGQVVERPLAGRVGDLPAVAVEADRPEGLLPLRLALDDDPPLVAGDIRGGAAVGGRIGVEAGGLAESALALAPGEALGGLEGLLEGLVGFPPGGAPPAALPFAFAFPCGSCPRTLAAPTWAVALGMERGVEVEDIARPIAREALRRPFAHAEGGGVVAAMEGTAAAAIPVQGDAQLVLDERCGNRSGCGSRRSRWRGRWRGARGCPRARWAGAYPWLALSPPRSGSAPGSGDKAAATSPRAPPRSGRPPPRRGERTSPGCRAASWCGSSPRPRPAGTTGDSCQGSSPPPRQRSTDTSRAPRPGRAPARRPTSCPPSLRLPVWAEWPWDPGRGPPRRRGDRRGRLAVEAAARARGGAPPSPTPWHAFLRCHATLPHGRAGAAVGPRRRPAGRGRSGTAAPAAPGLFPS